MVYEFTIPNMRLVSEANARDKWGRIKRTKAARESGRVFTYAVVPLVVRSGLWTRAVITMIRMGPRKLDDDNLHTAFKALRDGIASALRRDDGDPSYTWHVAQEKGPYAVRVRIEIESGP